MATVIRFARHGKKKMPFFRIVVQDSRAPRDGRFIEHIGSFDPAMGRDKLVVDRSRLDYWLGTGAQMSDSVRTRLKKAQGAEAPPAAAAPPAKKKKAREAEA